MKVLAILFLVKGSTPNSEECFVQILVHEGKMMEVKSSFALHCKVDIDKVVSPRQQANQPGNEEYETLRFQDFKSEKSSIKTTDFFENHLDALQMGMTVCNDTSENQT